MAKQSVWMFFVVVSMSSCIYEVYRPTAPFVPLISKKNECVVESHVGTSGIGISAAYSPLKYMYFTSNATFRRRILSNNNPPDSISLHESWAVGTGIFHVQKKDKNQEILYAFEAGFGSGFGKKYVVERGYFAEDYTKEYLVSGNYQKIYLQPSIGVKLSDFNVQFLSGMRFSYLFYKDVNLKTKYSDPESYDVKIRNPEWKHYYAFSPEYYCFEPFGQITAVGKYISLITYIGISATYEANNTDKNDLMSHYPVIINLGINLSVDKVLNYKSH